MNINNGLIHKIISGGQSGADIAGLEAGRALGIETGGTVPPGWIKHDDYGRKVCAKELLQSFGCVEGKADPSIFRLRTIKNAQDADGTLWMGRVTSPGARLTLSSSTQRNKPAPIINPRPEELRAWIIKNRIKILNVAGNRECKFPGIGLLTKTLLIETLSIR